VELTLLLISSTGVLSESEEAIVTISEVQQVKPGDTVLGAPYEATKFPPILTKADNKIASSQQKSSLAVASLPQGSELLAYCSSGSKSATDQTGIESGQVAKPAPPVEAKANETPTSEKPRDVRNPDGSKLHFEYDPATGKPKTCDYTNPKTGVKAHTEFDPDTGKPKTTDKWYMGIHDHIEYDPKTGKPLTEDEEIPAQASNPSNTHTRWNYDPKTGKLVSKDESGSNGYRAHTEYDPNTGKPTSFDMASDLFGKSHTEYDPNTGKPKFTDISYNEDGSTDHIEYDPKTGHIKTRDYTSANRTKYHVDCDPATGKPLSVDVTKPDGSKQHIPFNSKDWPDEELPPTYEDPNDRGSLPDSCQYLWQRQNPNTH
jgi:hypothetical protein